MITTQWRVSPELDAPRTRHMAENLAAKVMASWLGSLAEVSSGARPKVWLATGKEQVVAVVGKRGSGKSFTLGVIAEGLAAKDSLTCSRTTSTLGLFCYSIP